MKRTVIAQQGEAKVFRIDALPKNMQTRAPERTKSGAAIISHSESGHHHCIADAEVLERVDNVPAGMAILYAIVKNPTALRQDATSPHGEIKLDPGLYEFRVSREYDPFAEQIRRVAD
jgi:hypothetical protein